MSTSSSPSAARPAISPGPTQDHWGLEVLLGVATAPVLVGLIMAQSAGQWLQALKLSEQVWGSEHRLPPLDPQALRERQERLQVQAQSALSPTSAEGDMTSSAPEESGVNLEN